MAIFSGLFPGVQVCSYYTDYVVTMNFRLCNSPSDTYMAKLDIRQIRGSKQEKVCTRYDSGYLHCFVHAK